MKNIYSNKFQEKKIKWTIQDYFNSFETKCPNGEGPCFCTGACREKSPVTKAIKEMFKDLGINKNE